MDLLKLPFFTELEKSNKILLAGAGGGFDIFSGLPLYFGLRSLGKQVYLANWSFSNLYNANGTWLEPTLMEVTAETTGWGSYFPELYLAQWFAERGENVPIYCFAPSGVLPLLNSYQALVKLLDLDTVVLVDGGTDSLMRGDEAGLGTPQEDIASMGAVNQLEISTKLLVCLGFGVDSFHGVSHGQVLEAIADLTQAGGFLGVWSLLQEMPEVQLYKQATLAVFEQMPNHPSIVSASVISALEGHFGDYHATERTHGSQLFINPLMTLYWCFRLKAVADRILYLGDVLQTQTYQVLTLLIDKYRTTHQAEIKKWLNIPM
jgi:hypothetical protein